jgi:4-amino-4-deoxy-L-arabinose transferase-like glycosyltransferase
LAGVILRLGLWAVFRDRPLFIYDEKYLYNALATSILKDGEFALTRGEPTTNRPPLYPLFLAGVYHFSGLDNFQAVRLAQAGISLLTVLLLYLTGTEIDGRRTGLLLSGLYCFYPSMLIYNNLLLTEVLFTFLLCASIYSLALLHKGGKIWVAVISGTLLALAALTRSVLWLLPMVLCPCLAFTLSAPFRKRLLLISALLAAFIITLTPWAIRSTRLEKTLTIIDTSSGRNFMMGNYRHTPLYRAWDAITLEGERSWHHELVLAHPELPQTTQGQRDRLAMYGGITFALHNPGLTLERDFIKFFNFWQLERELLAGAGRGYFGSLSLPLLGALAIAIVGSYVAIMITGIFGIIMAAPSRAYHWLLLCIIVFVCAMHSISFGHSRYHLPLIPFIAFYAARAIVSWRAILRRRGQWSFRFATVICCILAAYWVVEIAVLDYQRWSGLVLGPITAG